MFCHVFLNYNFDVLMTSGKYYPAHRRDEGPSVGLIVSQHVDKMGEVMMHNVTTKTMLDVESKVHLLTMFLQHVQCNCGVLF